MVDEPRAVEVDQDPDLRASLAGLASLATGEMTLSAVLTTVAEYAGADGAAVTPLQRGRPDTFVANADFVREVDTSSAARASGESLPHRVGPPLPVGGDLGLWPRTRPRRAR